MREGVREGVRDGWIDGGLGRNGEIFWTTPFRFTTARNVPFKTFFSNI